VIIVAQRKADKFVSEQRLLRKRFVIIVWLAARTGLSNFTLRLTFWTRPMPSYRYRVNSCLPLQIRLKFHLEGDPHKLFSSCLINKMPGSLTMLYQLHTLFSTANCDNGYIEYHEQTAKSNVAVMFRIQCLPGSNTGPQAGYPAYYVVSLSVSTQMPK
jgi:hypothetical protein